MPDASMPNFKGMGKAYKPLRWYTSMKFKPMAL
jgi:hypothetical protein